MTSATAIRVDKDELTQLVAAILEGLGAGAEEAATVARAIIAADARGFPSHGVALLPYYKSLVDQGLDPAGKPEVVVDNGAVAVVDGNNGFGHLAATAAMEAAIERAQRFGVGAAAVRRSNHCGAMSVYSNIALRAHMVGIAMTNAMPTMAPWGSRERILGMNPISIAIPAGAQIPVNLDVSFAVAARGKIVLLAKESEALPDGWALDESGAPTTDAQKALAGLLKPIGDYKGTGLALAFGLLSTTLSGAAFGSRLGSLESGPNPGVDGQLMIALDVSAFTEVDGFNRLVDDILAELRASEPAEGSERVRLPGERSAEEERVAAREGVQLSPAAAAGLRQLADELGVQADHLLRDRE